MRGHPDQGSIKAINEVTPCVGGFKGRLSIPFDGTRHTEVYADRNDAVAALADLVSQVYPKPTSNGVSTAQASDFAAALAERDQPVRGYHDNSLALAA